MGHYIVVLDLLPDMDIYIFKFGMVWYGMVCTMKSLFYCLFYIQVWKILY